MPRNRKSCLVIGAGISGLCAAYWLAKEGYDVTVIEKEKHAGGTMKTKQDGGFLIDLGPNSALETTPLFHELFADLHILDQRVYANELANKRYILKEGKLHPIPLSIGSFLKTNLWSTKGKLRMMKEPFVGRAHREESIAEFVERRLGREFLDYAINPFVAGVYAGKPEELSVQDAFPKLYRLEDIYGGLVKGLIKGRKERKQRSEQSKQSAKMFSFFNGMKTFPNALANALGERVKCNTTAVNISRKKSLYEVVVKSKSRKKKFTAENIILATPAYIAGSLLEDVNTSIAQTLNDIYYPPVALIHFGYRREDVEHPLDGFGFLIPENEQRRILGTIWSSTIFPNRAPEGYVAFTTFVGGSRQPEITQLSDNELQEIVHKELSSILKINKPPDYVVIKKWEKAIPQYRLGYSKVLNAIEQFENSKNGIYLVSNYRGGIAVGDCVISAHRIAKTILNRNQ